MTRNLPFGLMLGLFLASGATGLVDQLCFSKYLAYIVGATAHAVSAVLAAFMTGLALGAHWGGRWSSRLRRPLLAYGLLELAVAITVAAAPLGFHWLTPLYAAWARSAPNSIAILSLLRWCVALSLVVIPTAAMGATLPFLSRAIEHSEDSTKERRERRLATLYAANTLGGALGALAAAYAIVPALGVNGTVFASAATSALVGVVALIKGRALVLNAAPASVGMPSSSSAPHEGRESGFGPSSTDRWRLGTLAFASGALVFASEVVFTHLLALIIGSSAYAFGLILAAFLCSLFLGASLSGMARRWCGEAALALGLAAAGLALVATLPLWDDLPELFASSGKTITTFAMREVVRGATAFAVLLVPTSLMGLTFPLLLQRVAGYASVGRWVGRLTAINTLGAVAGALGSGYWVLPQLGSQASLVAIGLAFVGSAFVAWPWIGPRYRWATSGAAAMTALAAGVGPKWDLTQLTSGANVYFEGQKSTQRLVSIREDVHGGVTTVALADGVYTLYTNGKFQGNTGWEMNAQRFFAHYPSMFVPRFDRALVIGLGTGTTLGTLATYPWKRLDVAEISPGIVEAASRYFRGPNLGALDDPRVHLTYADGRNYLLVTDQKYDLISIELSSIWFAGAANLYSREFYALVASRLREGGVFQQWVQLHHILRRDFATILHTLRLEFPHVALFYGGGQGILVSSLEPLRTSMDRLRALEARPNLQSALPYGRPLEELLDDVLVVDDGLDAFLAASAREEGESIDEWVSTDTNLYLEYATPRGNVLPWETRDALVADLMRYRDENAIAAMIQP